MRVVTLLLILFVVCQCKNDVENYAPVDAKIKIGESYEIDVKAKIYTVFFLEKPPLKVKFQLTVEEEREIYKYYSNIDFAGLAFEEPLPDNCNMFPKIYTQLIFHRANRDQKVVIDIDCDKFPSGVRIGR